MATSLISLCSSDFPKCEVINLEIQISDSYPRRGRRGLDFHYVLESNKLYHVSKYAKRIVDKRRSDGFITYILDLDRLPSEWIYVFGRTNSGYPYFGKYRVESLLGSRRDFFFDVSEEELAKLKLGDFSPEFQRYFDKYCRFH